jgi:hypothetical protein
VPRPRTLVRLATDGPVLDLSSANAAQAIVILAGGLRYNAGEHGESEGVGVFPTRYESEA